MKYFAVILPLKDEEKSKTYRPKHLDFLEKMRQEKKVLMNGRFVDGTGGLVIYIGENIEQVEAWVKEDPFIVHGARDYNIHEWDMVTDATISLHS
ncbi:YciI family protein [Virgibacillus sp. W0430]|uniref:YciI family protein n=1 Tax=Virgibacillus sp. W0430 TaxID=3391580 RepID=UPI003F460FF2